MDGFINISKPAGITSSKVVTIVKHTLHIKKVGHAGTLDPDAVGVLPIMLGKATKLFDYLNLDTKFYRAMFSFGTHTNTLDAGGEILNTSDIIPDEAAIVNALPEFIGLIQQIPPKVSAISIDGKRAYDLARKGIEFEIKPRNVNIYSFELLEKSGDNKYLFDIECSKGTYIRSLCRDLAQSLGTYAHISFLSRLRSGYFKIDTAITLEQLKNYYDDGRISDYIIPIDEPIMYMKRIDIHKKNFGKITNGVAVKINDIKDIPYLRAYCDGSFIGIGHIKNNYLKIIKLLYGGIDD